MSTVLRRGALAAADALGVRRQAATVWRALHPTALRHELDLLRDEWVLRRAHGPALTVGADAADPGRVVLLVSLTNWVAQVKQEAMLALALRLAGYTPVVLARRGHRRARRYFRAFGITRFVYLDDYLEPAAEPAPATAEPRTGMAMRDLLALEWEGADVGRHALSSLTRELRYGSLPLHDPRIAPLVARALAESRRAARAARSLVADTRPEMALLNEKGYTPYGEVFDALLGQGVNTIQWVHTHRADAIAFKRYTRENRDLHPFSVSPETWRQVRAMDWTPEHDAALDRELRGRYEEGTWFNRKFLQVGKSLMPPDEVRRRLGLDPRRKTSVIFSHVLWDATFFYGDNLFDDYEDWLVETVRVARETPSVNWVVKVHPDYVWKLKQMGLDVADQVRDVAAIRERVGPLPDHVRLLWPDTDISTLSVFAVTDYGLTVRGTVGIELPCFGVPVLTAGSGRYSGLGFTEDFPSREAYLARLRTIDEVPPLSSERTLLARKHAYALLRLRPCPFSTFETVHMALGRLGHPLDQNVVIHARSARDLAEAPDLRAFAAWASETRAPDFLLDQPAALVAV